MSGLVKKDNYICIQGWMLSDLSLSGTELIIYAIIYGFSQDGNSAFAGTLSYLMQWSNTSKNTVLKALRSLMNMRLITKTEDTVSGVKVCRYTAVRSSSGMDSTDSKAEPGVQKLNGSGAETEPGVQKLNGGGAETEPNNLNNNLNNNLGYSDNKTGISQHGGVKPSADVPSAGVPSNVKICSEFDTLWSQYPEGRKQGRMQALAKYTQVRKQGTSYQQVLDGLLAYKRQIDVEQTPLKYVKQGGTWFSQESWLDEFNTKIMVGSRVAPKRGSNPALGYKQHTYTAEQLKELGIDIGEDVYEDEGHENAE